MTNFTELRNLRLTNLVFVPEERPGIQKPNKT